MKLKLAWYCWLQKNHIFHIFQDRLEHYSYFGIPAYNAASVDAQVYSGNNMSIPRPQMRQEMPPQPNGLVIPNESSTDPILEYAREAARHDERLQQELRAKNYRAQDTFQRDLHRTLNQYRRESGSSQGYSGAHPTHYQGGHMWFHTKPVLPGVWQ